MWSVDILEKYRVGGIGSLSSSERRTLGRLAIIYHDSNNDFLNDVENKSDFVCVTSDNYGRPASHSGYSIGGFTLRQWKETDRTYKINFINNIHLILSGLKCYVLTTDIGSIRSNKDVMLKRQFDDYRTVYDISERKGKRYYKHKNFWVTDAKGTKRYFEISEDNLLSLYAKCELFSYVYEDVKRIHAKVGRLLMGGMIMADMHSGDAALSDSFSRKYTSIIDGLCNSMYVNELHCLNYQSKSLYVGQLLSDNISGMFKVSRTLEEGKQRIEELCKLKLVDRLYLDDLTH